MKLRDTVLDESQSQLIDPSLPREGERISVLPSTFVSMFVMVAVITPVA